MGRDPEKLANVAKALEKGLSVAEIVALTGISRASVKRYRQELALPYLCPILCNSCKHVEENHPIRVARSTSIQR